MFFLLLVVTLGLVPFVCCVCSTTDFNPDFDALCGRSHADDVSRIALLSRPPAFNELEIAVLESFDADTRSGVIDDESFSDTDFKYVVGGCHGE